MTPKYVFLEKGKKIELAQQVSSLSFIKKLIEKISSGFKELS